MKINFDKLEEVQEKFGYNYFYLDEILQIFQQEGDDYPRLLGKLSTYIYDLVDSEHESSYQEGYDDGYIAGQEEAENIQ